MKDYLREFVPPIFLEAIREMAAPPVYDSYEKALAACGDAGYQSHDIVKAVVDKNAAFKQQLLASPTFELPALRTLIAMGLVHAGESSLNVVDFGGGGGYHYFLAKVAMRDRVDLRWNVVETPAMAEEAQRLADANLHFFRNIEDAAADLRRVDLVFTSSALQYCPDPFSTLRALLDIGAKDIFLTRMALSSSKNSFISTQASKLSDNGPGPLPTGSADRTIRYPITFTSKHAIEQLLMEKYVVNFSITEERRSFRAGKHVFDTYGYFCSLR
jgi:putative methyltransferase (TIGR04325 family)